MTFLLLVAFRAVLVALAFYGAYKLGVELAGGPVFS